MNVIEKITVSENIALATVCDAPCDIGFLTRFFNMVARKNISVDMISQTAPINLYATFSFSFPFSSLGDIMDVCKEIRKEYPKINTAISCDNIKISFYGSKMPDNYGVAAKVFEVISSVCLDVRLVTTSETDISLLITTENLKNIIDTLETEFSTFIDFK
jgi:aspartate kinase